MLGTEYSWLITISKPVDGTPRVRLASTGLLTIAVGVFCLLCATLRAEPAHSGHFDFVSNSDWALFEKSKEPPSPRTVTILRTQLE